MNKTQLHEWGKNKANKIDFILNKSESTELKKLRYLYLLLLSMLDELLEDSGIIFTSTFSKLAFAGNSFGLKGQTMFAIHRFRKLMESEAYKDGVESNHQALALFSLSHILFKVAGLNLVEENGIQTPDFKDLGLQVRKRNRYVPQTRAVVLDYMEDSNVLLIIDQDAPEAARRVGLEGLDLAMQDSLDFSESKELNLFPLTVNLIDVQVQDDGQYNPQQIILEPDYLIDVTALASCFTSGKYYPVLYLVKKFLKVQSNPSLVLGNLANQMLDMIITQEDIQYKDFVPQIFPLDPLAFAKFENTQVRNILAKAVQHFSTIKEVVQQEFDVHGINRKHVFLEPSFFTPEYGIQGRLDLLDLDLEHNKVHIVELKSGRAFQANAYGLGISHYIQTLLYDLMVKTVYQNKVKPVNFILYSGESKPNLRFAPLVKSQQIQALALRNELIRIEQKLCLNDSTLTRSLLEAVDGSKYPNIKGFSNANLNAFQKHWTALNDLEKKYVERFISFIAKEQHYSKIGPQNQDKRRGFARLWLGNLDDKLEDFSIMNHLLLHTNNSMEDPPTIILKASPQTNQLSNFRVGDIVVLYPNSNEKQAYVHQQIFKASIIESQSDAVTLRLRARQLNQNLFNSVDFWHLEHDHLDSGFNRQFEAMFEFMKSKPSYRNLVLGKRAPASSKSEKLAAVEGLTDEQFDIYEAIINAQEYYLLWGPPGTGKTSVMLHHIVRHLVQQKKERILLLAYTNKAVDEICRAVESLGSDWKDSYVRLGSRYSCGASFKHALLDTRTKGIVRRKQLREELERYPIYISTVATINGKQNLMDLLDFDRCIVDEASQILEPNLIGLLQYFPKWVLIGDHRQLPAVVVQDEKISAVDDAELHSIGLENCRDSFFERLYVQCLKKDWSHALGRLSYQGRMHPDLMAFPKHTFYNGRLSALPSIDRFKKGSYFPAASKDWQARMLYFNTPKDEASSFLKTNRFEAEKVLEIVVQLKELMKEERRDWLPEKIGIISPYRAQIAAIAFVLEEAIPGITDKISIDTVERYQGGAKDIIILSFCTNDERQFKNISSVSREGIDRKLNVALTRAREQIYLIGNQSILSKNIIYNQLIEYVLSIQ